MCDKDFPFPKVELHLHVDGALRFETILELAKKKGLDVGADTVEQLREKLVLKPPYSLDKMLQTFHVFMPTVIGDEVACERMAYELCEDQAKNGVIYFEGRFSPHFLSNTHQSDVMKLTHYDEKKELSPAQATAAILRGFKRGEKDFGVKARGILCSIRSHPHWAKDILELAIKYKDDGIVAIDLAGCAHGGSGENIDKESANLEIFQKAKELGIRRTIHAGESGSSSDVKYALDAMHAERIGHGYHALDDPELFARMLKDEIHFEMCPTSSLLTGAYTGPWNTHPIAIVANRNGNFSVNTDDPTPFGNYLNDELRLVRDKIGLSLQQIWQAQLNAARSCFLPEDEKLVLVKQIEAAKP